MKIGFFDSGIGGITVLHQALKLLPNEEYLFYADTSNVPYGEKTKEEVKKYIFQVVEFLANQGIEALVIACNTATSIAANDLRRTYNFPILGIEPAVKPAVQNSKGNAKKVLVMATNLTLQEEKFHSLVQSVDKNDVVDFIALPGLVELAEKFKFDDETVIPYLEDALYPLNLYDYGTVVLGCTHFPYFTNSIKNILPKGVDIISGSVGTAKNLDRILKSRDQNNQSKLDIKFFKSGNLITDKETLDKYWKLFEKLDELKL
ncbi:glutamate racemase (plasmid) [Niallia circulans]|uniref:Glutamate racemase n=1 Tax=Niallia circulans TaxID=1397 RepID=A0A553SQG0_NIACI|nr:glutamate racemase [Niallia circulans]TRZ39230.1 glutamate racemase [Niallia circulans]